MSDLLLELDQLACERDDRLLFAQLTARFSGGDLVQILGPNGAGKTSLLRIIAGLTPASSGDIRYLGQSLNSSRWQFAQDSLYLGHLAGIKKSLTPLENLHWFAAQQPAQTHPEVALQRVGLRGYEDTSCDQLSAGQFRRVALARLHLTMARIWILDEPFTAIDKSGVDMLEGLLKNHQAAGGLILLTSHQDLAIPGIKQIHLQDFCAKSAEEVA
jgi:heme exporter protein A